MKYLVLIFCMVAFSLGVVGTALAQGGDRYPPGVDPNEVYKIARKLYCDVCQGVPLADCPSNQCRAWREEIADLLALGYTEAQILEHFADRYGDKVSGVPLNSSNRRLTYAVPILLVSLAALGIGWQLYRWNKRDENRALQVARTAGTREDFARPVPDNVDSDYLDRVLKALEETYDNR